MALKTEYEDSNVIIKKIYPVVEAAMDKREARLRDNIAKFMNERHDLLFDIAPYDRIYFNQTDIDNIFKSLGLQEADVEKLMKEIYYYNIPYNPQCAKDTYVIVLLMCTRYYLKHNKSKFAELTTIFLAFSGKFYASLHGGAAFPTAPPSKYRTVMDFVVNNLLTDKYDLKKEGTVFGAVKSLCITWLDTYGKDLMDDDITDDGIGKRIQQLRERERSFLMNIAKVYYGAFENRSYLNYETDNLDEENFRLTDNDAMYAARLTMNVINYITSNYVSMDFCNKCKDANIKALELKDILETIFAYNKNLPSVKRAVNILICDFMRNYPGQKVGSIEFVSYSLKAKPNTKDPILIECKEIILSWLDENSPNYRKRKSRLATQNSYYRAVLMYLVLLINKVGR